ncbi:hypothetical protein C823_001904 [Eubacterium plexicaudatum ASF492]|nr:hypothetical protein C823_001904 [Eubacterium plexicaudatum ASF492]
MLWADITGKGQRYIPQIRILCTGYKKGERITKENVRVIRPGYGLAPTHYEELLGQTALCDIKRGTPVKMDMFGRCDTDGGKSQ